MRPDFQILADAEDITAIIRDRLLALEIVDEAGIDSDTAKIELDDRPPVIALPRTGAELDIAIGYRETGVAKMGVYVVDEINLSGPPAKLTIRARAADLRQQMKAPRTRSFDNISLGDLVARIAADHGAECFVAPDLAGIALVHIDQVGESDLHILTRLAADYGAVAKPAGRKLLFVPRGEAKNASGKALPEIVLTRGDCSGWRVTISERGKYGAVSAAWHDPAAGERKTVTAGSGKPVFEIGRAFSDEAEASQAAVARLAAFHRGEAVLQLDMAGDNRLASEGRLMVSGIRQGIDGKWVNTRVRHVLDRGGYRCSISAETEQL